MMDELILNKIKNIYLALNEIEVKGESNVSYMFGSLSALKEVIISLEKSKGGETNVES